jgi:MFS family permease
VFSFALLAAEIPTGYVGDAVGRRISLALGNLCRVVALLGYVVADTAVAFLALKVVLGVGWALRSGTVDAWLYEVLQARLDATEYARIEGRGSTALLATSAVTAVAGSLLYSVHTATPFLANAALAAVGVPILYSFPAVETQAGGDPFTLGDAVRTLKAQASRPDIRWLVVYTVLVFTIFDLSRTFEQPSLRAVNVPVAGFGLLYAGYKIVSAAAAASVGWFEDALGTGTTLALATPVLGLAYASVAILPVAILPVFFLYRGGRTVLRPLRNQYLNDRLADVGRATVLSGVSMVLSLVGGVARLAGGPVAASTGPTLFLALAGVTLATLAGVVWLGTSPVRDHTGAPASNAGADAPVSTD